MAWQKGKSGNPNGRAKDKLIGDALRIAVNEEGPDGRRKLRLIVEKAVECAIAGEPWAVNFVADRLDGKPVQTLDATIERRTTNELSDGELHDIARSGRARASEKANGSAKPDSVH